MKTRLGTQEKTVGQTVRRDGDRARRKSVHRVGLVGGPHHQRREGQLHALRAVALEDERVERVEGEEVLIVLSIGADLREGPALRGVRVDIVEMTKVRRVLQVTEGRHAVGFVFPIRKAIIGARASEEVRAGEGERTGREGESGAARKPNSAPDPFARSLLGLRERGGRGRGPVRFAVGHERPLTLAAFAASHHQMVGNADMPYSGRFSGLPKRSHRAVRSFP